MREKPAKWLRRAPSHNVVGGEYRRQNGNLKYLDCGQEARGKRFRVALEWMRM